MAEELPRLHWDRDRLKELNSWGDGHVADKEPTLSQVDNIHDFFNEAQWLESDIHPNGFNKVSYDALRDSFAIASKLLGLRVVQEYMSLFLADDPITPIIHEQGGDISIADHYVAHKRSSFQGAVDRAQDRLRSLSADVYWMEDDKMWSDLDRRYSGLTTIGHPPVGNPTRGQTLAEIEEWDHKFKNEKLPNRKITVFLPSQVIDALVGNPRSSKARTRAVFFAAYTMVHEIGHVIYWQNFKHQGFQNPGRGNEPKFGDDCLAELGDALMAQIFGGWTIQPISLNDGHPPPLDPSHHFRMMTFDESGFYWVQWLRDNRRDPLDGPPGYKTCYPISFDHIVKYTQAEFWDRTDVPDNLPGRFAPIAPFLSDKHYRRGEPSNTHGCRPFTDQLWNNPERVVPSIASTVPAGGEWSRFVDVKPPGTNWTLRPKNTQPPVRWDESDLERTGAIDPNFSHISDLEPVELHNFFRREAWPRLSDDRYNALRPAFQLATRLIDLSADYYPTFLPVAKKEATWPAPHLRIAVNQNPSEQEMQEAKERLLEISNYTTWVERDKMVAENKYGETTYIGDSRETEEQKKTPVRLLTIEYSPLYADALLDATEGTARQLTATFHAAITLVHEIGHAIYYGNRTNAPLQWPAGQELWVGDDLVKEFGDAKISRLFGGFYPETAPLYAGIPTLEREGNPVYNNYKREMDRFEVPLAWHLQEQWTTQKLLWYTEYSIPLSYIKRLFTQKTWDDVRASSNIQRSQLERLRFVRQKLLHPSIPFDPTTHSRRLRPFFFKPSPWQPYEWIHKYAIYKGYQRTMELSKGFYHNKGGAQPPISFDDIEEFDDDDDDIFQPSKPQTYPYIDPYWGDDLNPMSSATEQIVPGPMEQTAPGPMEQEQQMGSGPPRGIRFGVELEMVFVFCKNQVIDAAAKFAGGSLHNRAPFQTIHPMFIKYEDRDRPPLNIWGDELLYRAYNSFALRDIHQDEYDQFGQHDLYGQLYPMSVEMPVLLAEFLKKHPAVNFPIDPKVNALEYLKNAERYKTWSVVPDTSVRGVGPRNIPHWLPRKISVPAGDVSDSFGLEVVSRVLNTDSEEDWKEIEAICTALNNPELVDPPVHGAFTNNTTALHVHVEAPADLNTMKRLAFLVVVFEDEISRLHPLCQQKEHLTATNSLETNRQSFWAVPNEPNQGLQPLESVYDRIFGLNNLNGLIRLMNPPPRGNALRGRHRLVNFTYADRAGDTKTVEFRQHRGTLVYDEIQQWAKFVISLVELAGRADNVLFGKGTIRDWDDEKIDIFALFRAMSLETPRVGYWKSRISRYMDYPVYYPLNEWHLELPPGSQEPGFGPPCPTGWENDPNRPRRGGGGLGAILRPRPPPGPQGGPSGGPPPPPPPPPGGNDTTSQVAGQKRGRDDDENKDETEEERAAKLGGRSRSERPSVTTPVTTPFTPVTPRRYAPPRRTKQARGSRNQPRRGGNQQQGSSNRTYGPSSDHPEVFDE